MISLKTIMIPSDYEGDKMNPEDCPGYRAFSRALKQLPWYKRIFISKSWCVRDNNYNWYSYKNNKSVSMMSGTKVGDIIEFREE